MTANSVVPRKRVYSVRDDKLQQYAAPCLVENDAVASRSFGDSILKTPDSPIALHKGDYSLWYLGDMELETGKFVNMEDAHIVCRASDFGDNANA